jgi:hypothetical protein
MADNSSVLGQDPIVPDELKKPTQSGSNSYSSDKELFNQINKTPLPNYLTSRSSELVLPENVSRKQFQRRLGEYAPVEGYNIEETIAEKQSGIEQVGMGLGRIGLKIATEVSKLPGSVYGTAKFITGEEFGDAFNNAWLVGIDRFNEEVNQNNLPVFQSEKYKEGNFLERLTTTSFWATEGADGVGFLLSMMVPGMAFRFGKVGQKLAGLMQSVETLNIADKTADAANVVSKSIDLASDASKLGRASTKLSTSSELLAGRLNDVGATAINTVFEAVEEGRGSFNDYLRLHPEDKDGAAEAGRNTFVHNIGILAASNYLDQKWLFGGAKKLTSASVVEKATKEISKDSKIAKLLEPVVSGSADLTKKITKPSLASKIGEGVLTFSKGFVKEGFFEEGIQTAISHTSQDSGSWNPIDVLDTYLDYITSPLGSEKNTEMWSSVVLGGLMGAPMSVYGDYKENKAVHKQAEEYRKLLADDYTAHTKSLRELAKTVDGKPQFLKDKNGKDTTVYDLDEEKVRNQGEKIARISKLKDKYFKALDSGDEEMARYVLENLNFEYARKWLTIEGGETLLRKHIDNLAKVKAKQELDEKGFNTKTEKELRDEFLSNIPKWKTMVDQLNDTHDLTLRHLLGNMPEGATKDDYNNFSDDIKGNKMSARVDLLFGEERSNFLLNAIKNLSKNPKYTSILEKNEELFNKLDAIFKNDESAGKAKAQEEVNRIIKEVEDSGSLDAIDVIDFKKKLNDYFRALKLVDRSKETLKQNHDQSYLKKMFNAKIQYKKAIKKDADNITNKTEEKDKPEAFVKDPLVSKLREDNVRSEEIPTIDETLATDNELETGFVKGNLTVFYHRARKKLKYKNRETSEVKEAIVVIGDANSKGDLKLRVVEENSKGEEIKRGMMYLKTMDTVADDKNKLYDVVSIEDYKSVDDIIKSSQTKAVITVYQSIVDDYESNIKKHEDLLKAKQNEFEKIFNRIDKLEEEHPVEARKRTASSKTTKFAIKIFNEFGKLRSSRNELKKEIVELKNNLSNWRKAQEKVKKDLKDFRKNPEFPLDTLMNLIRDNDDIETRYGEISNELQIEINKNEGIIRTLLPLVKSYSKTLSQLVNIDLSKVRKQEEGEDDIDYYLDIYNDLINKMDIEGELIINNLSKFPGWGFVGDPEFENKEYVYKIAVGIRDKIRLAIGGLAEAKEIQGSIDETVMSAQKNLKSLRSRYNRIVETYSKQYANYFRGEKDAYDLELIEADEAEINMEERHEGSLEKHQTRFEEDELHPYKDFNSFFILSSNQKEALTNEDVARWFSYTTNYAWQGIDDENDEPPLVFRTFTYTQATKLSEKVRKSLKFYTSKGMLTIAEVEEKGLGKEALKDIKVIAVNPKDNSFIYVSKYGETKDKKTKKEHLIFSSLGDANLQRETDLMSKRFSFENAYEAKRIEISEEGGDPKTAEAIVDAEVKANLQKFKEFRTNLVSADEQVDLYIQKLAPGHKEMEGVKPIDVLDGINVPLGSMRFHVSTARKNEDERVTEYIPSIGEVELTCGFTYVVNRDRPELVKPVTLGETGDVDNILNLLRYVASGKEKSNEVLEYVRTIIAMQNFKGDESDKGRIFFKRKTKRVQGKLQLDRNTFDVLYFGSDQEVTIDQLIRGEGLDVLREYLDTKYWNFKANLLNSKKRFEAFTQYKVDSNLKLSYKLWSPEKGGYVGFLFSRADGNKSKGKVLLKPIPEGEHKNFQLAMHPQYSNRAVYTSPDKHEVEKKKTKIKQEASIVSDEIIDTLDRNLDDFLDALSKSITIPSEFKAELAFEVFALSKTDKSDKEGARVSDESNGSFTIILKNGTKLSGLPGTSVMIKKGNKEFVKNLLIHYVKQLPNKVVVEESTLTPSKLVTPKKKTKDEESIPDNTTEDDKLTEFNEFAKSGKEAKEYYDHLIAQAADRFDEENQVSTLTPEERNQRIMYMAASDFFDSAEDFIDDTKDEEPPFAKVANKPIGSYTVEQQKNIDWLRKTFPTLFKDEKGLQIVNELIEGDKWGLFFDGSKVMLSSYAEEGTAFHEGYHVWSKLFNSDEQQKVLYDAVRKITGQELTDKQAEEYLADNFRDYMILGDKYEFAKVEEPIKNWFEKLLSYLKDFVIGLLNHVGLNITISQASDINVIQNAFKSLENGIYVNPINTTNEKFAKIGTVNTKKQIALIRDMSAKFFRYIVQGLETGNDVILSVDRSFDDVYKLMLGAYWVDVARKKRNGQVSVYEDLVKNWDAFRQSHEESLVQYGINIIEDETDEEEIVSRNHSDYSDPIRFSMKDNAKAPIKLLIAALPSIREHEMSKEFGTQSNVQFDKIMNTLYNSLQGLTTTDDMMDKLKSLTNVHPEFNILIQQLNGPTNAQNLLRAQFFNSFATNKNKVEVQVVDNNNTRLHSDLIDKVDRESIKKTWMENAQTLAIKNQSVYVSYKNGDYIVDIKKLKSDLINLSPENISMVFKNLGIVDGLLDTSTSIKELLSEGEVVNFVNQLKQELYRDSKKRTENEIFLTDIFVPEILDIQTRINSLADLAVKETMNDRELMYFNMQNNMEWAVTKNSHVSNIKNRLNRLRTIGKNKPIPKNLQHLIPFDGKTGNIYTMHSKHFDSIRNRQEAIEYYLIKGSTNIFQDGKELNEGTNHEYKAVTFDYILHNKIPFKRSADRGPEQAIKVGNSNFKMQKEFFIDDMMNYIKDELIGSFAIRSGSPKFGVGIRYYEDNVRELRTFSFIYDPQFKGKLDIPTIDEFLKGQKKSSLAVGKNLIALTDKFVEENRGELIEIFSKYIDYLNFNTKQSLLDSNIIIEKNEKGIPQKLYQFPGLNKNTITEGDNKGFGIKLYKGTKLYGSDLERMLLLHSYNYFVGMQEQMKLFFGDPAFYKDHQDLDKRTTSALSSYILTPNDKKTIDFLNAKPTKANGYTDYRKVSGHDHSDKVRKIIISNVRNTRKDDFLQEVSNLYDKSEIIDGQMWGTLDFIRSVMVRNGKYENYKYSDKLPSHEMTFQYEMQALVIRVLNTPGLQGIWNGANKSMFTSKDGIFYKHTKGLYTGVPMYNGVKINPYGEQHVDMMAHFPAIKSIGSGSMSNEGLNVSPHSTNKMSVAPIIPSLLSDKALKFVLSMMENDIDKFGDTTTEKSAAYINDINIENGDLITSDSMVTEMLYDDYGVQLEIKMKEESEVTDSSQKNTTLYNDVFDKGMLKIKDLEEDVKERDSILNEIDRRNMEEALDSLGIKKSNGKYTLVDEKVFKTQLRKLINNRLLPENLKEGLYVIFRTKTKLFDLVSDNKKMHSITSAYIRNNVIKRKINGRMLVQESSYLYTIGEEPLKFYREGNNGNLLRAEIILPLPDALVPFVNQVGGLDEFNKLLKVGKLPKELSDITANRIPTSRPNTIEAFTVVKYMPNYAGSRILLPYEVVTKTSSDYDIDKLTTYFNNFKLEYNDKKQKYEIIIPEYTGLNSDKEALENRLNVLSATAILHKDRKDIFLSPHSSDKLEKIAIEFYKPTTHLEKLEAEYSAKKKRGEIRRWHSIVEYWYNSKKALDFWDGIRGVAQAASQNVVHTQLQKNPIPLQYDIPLFFEGQEKEEDEQYISGHVEDFNKSNISETYEGFLVSFVDVAKKPFIINLLSNLDTYNIFTFLNRFGINKGVGIRQIAALASNPIVRKYILQSNINKSLFANNNMYLDKKIEVRNPETGRTKYVSDKFDEENFGYRSNVYERLTGLDFNKTVTKALEDYINNPSIENKETLDLRLKFSKYQYLTEDQLKSTRGTYDKQLLDNYMTYELLAWKNITLNSTLRPYAVTSFGKSLEEIDERKTRRKALVDSGAFADVDIQNAIDHSQIREIHKVYQDTIDAFGWTNLFFKYPKLNEFYNDFLNEFRKGIFKKDDLADVSNLIKSHFITYISVFDKNYSETKDLYNELFIAENSLVKQLAKLKASKKISSELFSQLRPVIKEWSKDLGRKRDNSYITTYNKKYGLDMDNILKGEFESLFETKDKDIVAFGTKLMQLALYQSGLRNSEHSFHPLIPNRHFVPFLDNKVSLAAMSSDEFDLYDDNVQAFINSFKDQFYRNNYMNSDIVQRARKAITISDILDEGTDLDNVLLSETKPLEIYERKREAKSKYLTVRMNKQSTKEIKDNIKSHKKSEVEYLLFKRDDSAIVRKGNVGFRLVGKLGDGSRMVEYYNVKSGDSVPSVIDSNNYSARALDIAQSNQSFTTKTDNVEFSTSRLGRSIGEKYRYRTIENAKESDVTIAMAYDFTTSGERLTKDSAMGFDFKTRKASSPEKYISIDLNKDLNINDVIDRLNKLKPKEITINIAGNSIFSLRTKHKMSQAHADIMIFNILEQIITNPKLNKKVKLIRSGGQTGIDESGIKAGIKLGIPVLIHAPKGWLIRDVNGNDKSLSEQKFKERFVKTETKPIEGTSDRISNISDKRYELDEDSIQTEAIPELDASVKDFLSAIGVTMKTVDSIKDHTGTKVPAIAVANLTEMTLDVTEGRRNINSLPEEAAHFYISLLNETDGLYKSMYDNIVNYPIYTKVLEAYSERYQGDEKKLREEAMAKLITERMTSGLVTDVTERQQSQATNWFTKLWQKIKQLLELSKTDPFAKSAYDILTKNISNLITRETKIIDDITDNNPLEEQWNSLPYPIKLGTVKYLYYTTIAEAESAFDRLSSQFGEDLVSIHPTSGDVNYRAKIAIKKPKTPTNIVETIVDKENISVNNAKEMAKNPIGNNWELSISNFKSYFPDYEWLSDEEKISLLRSIDKGEVELYCEF